MKIRKDVGRLVIGLLFSLSVLWFCPTTGYVQKTDPNISDTDGDGFGDGPDVWRNGYWNIGEDKNANGRVDPDGTDGIPGTYDDETDPRDPSSHADGPSSLKDKDGDGALDEEEDANQDGIYQRFGEDGVQSDDDETDWEDADTDDDGLSDGFERGLMYRPRMPDPLGGLTTAPAVPFYGKWRWMDPWNPDMDHDGLPDGLELGVEADSNGTPLTLAGYPAGIVPSLGPHVIPVQHRVDTDRNATFIFNAQTRNRFIPDTDPESITDPSEIDSNYDGTPDGEQDPLPDGRDTPAVGWQFIDAPVEPSKPFILQPEIEGGVWMGRGVEFNIVYQSSGQDDFSESSLSNIKLDQPLPTGAELIIKRIHTKKRFWRITLLLHSNWDFNASQPTKLWIETPHFNNFSAAKKITMLPPIIVANLAKTPCEVATYSAPPQFYGTDAAAIGWGCVSPFPLAGHWHDPSGTDVFGQLDLWAYLAWFPQTYVAVRAGREEGLGTLLDKWYGVEATKNFNGGNPTAEIRTYLERQWVLAMVYTEASGREYNKDNCFQYQREMVLTATVSASQFAYASTLPTLLGNKRWSRISIQKDDEALKKSQPNRMYDIINSSFYGSVPDDEKSIVANPKWKHLMNFVAGADFKKKFEPQWKMKPLNDMKLTSLNSKTGKKETKKYSEWLAANNRGALDPFIKDLWFIRLKRTWTRGARVSLV